MNLCNYVQYIEVTNNYNTGTLDLILSNFTVSVTNENTQTLSHMNQLFSLRLQRRPTKFSSEWPVPRSAPRYLNYLKHRLRQM